MILLIATIPPVQSRRGMNNIYPHQESRLGYQLLNCTGPFHDNRPIFAKFNAICFDCYRQYMDHAIYRNCRYVLTKQLVLIDFYLFLNFLKIRQNCFTNAWFQGCLELLQIKDKQELDKIKVFIRKFNDP